MPKISKNDVRLLFLSLINGSTMSVFYELKMLEKFLSEKYHEHWEDFSKDGDIKIQLITMRATTVSNTNGFSSGILSFEEYAKQESRSKEALKSLLCDFFEIDPDEI